MANYVINKIRLSGEQSRIDELLEKIKGESEVISFAKIIPISEIDSGTHNGAEICNLQCENWGVRCDASGSSVMEDNTIEFMTVWDRVMPVVERLAEMFPDISIEYSWAEECLGCYAGNAKFKDGLWLDEYNCESHSKEAYELAAELWGLDLAEEGYVYDEKSGTYEYRDEEEIQGQEVRQ